MVARAGRLLLYALALTGGALCAHLSAPGHSGASAAVEGADKGMAPVALSAVHRSTAPMPGLEPPTPSIEGGLLDALGTPFKGGRIIGGNTPHRLILFTFDDGPDRRYTPLLLDRLDAEGVRAVFFLTASRLLGRNVRERQQIAIAREIAARGHLVGSHTLDHEQLPLLNDHQVMEQVVRAERVFERVFGARPWLLRPPGGARSARVDRLVAERGYTTIMWNLGSGDFQVRSPEDVLETWRKVMERRERDHGDRGGIILLHDTHAWSVDAFQLIMAELQARNCALLARGEELYDVVDDPGLFFQARGKAPATAFAAPAQPPEAVLAARQARLRAAFEARCQRL